MSAFSSSRRRVRRSPQRRRYVRDRSGLGGFLGRVWDFLTDLV
ncbi:hypothetical protein [Streptomyces oryzae]|nr:hypothetical protein [Streptomyces oryzae]